MPNNRCAVLMTATIALGLAPCVAPADTTLVADSPNTSPGSRIALRATAAPAQSCTFGFDAYRSDLVVPDAGAFTISARVARRASARPHKVTLRCAAEQATTWIAVQRTRSNRSTRGPLFSGAMRIASARLSTPDGAPLPPASPNVSLASVSVLVGSALFRPDATPFPHSDANTSAASHTWWAAHQSEIDTIYRNGQCTDWAQTRRPDVVRSGFMARYDRVGPSAISMSWDAMEWPANASAAGLAVGHIPQVGAVMVYQPGAYGAGGPGHVAIVELVAPDGSFAVSNMHAPNVGEITEQTYDRATAAQMAADPGIAFIY